MSDKRHVHPLNKSNASNKHFRQLLVTKYTKHNCTFNNIQQCIFGMYTDEIICILYHFKDANSKYDTSFKRNR